MNNESVGFSTRADLMVMFDAFHTGWLRAIRTGNSAAQRNYFGFSEEEEATTSESPLTEEWL
jgi:hypothetical protein